MAKKRVVIISDLHCGHGAGLTPPQHQAAPAGMLPEKREKIVRVQQEMWKFYAERIDALKPIDILIVNGDAIDGRGDKSGGTEQITVDRNNQVAIAIDAVRYTGAKKYFFTYGTAYHTGTEEDFEDTVATQCGAKIGAHEWIDVNGLIFDCKHHLGSSSNPTGRHNAVAREVLWNTLWHERGEAPKSDVTIRSHVHYFNYCGGLKWLAMSTPALQGYGSKYGARRCSGTIDVGFVHFDVKSKEDFTWDKHLFTLNAQQATIAKA